MLLDIYLLLPLFGLCCWWQDLLPLFFWWFRSSSILVNVAALLWFNLRGISLFPKTFGRGTRWSCLLDCDIYEKRGWGDQFWRHRIPFDPESSYQCEFHCIMLCSLIMVEWSCIIVALWTYELVLLPHSLFNEKALWSSQIKISITSLFGRFIFLIISFGM